LHIKFTNFYKWIKDFIDTQNIHKKIITFPTQKNSAQSGEILLIYHRLLPVPLVLLFLFILLFLVLCLPFFKDFLLLVARFYCSSDKDSGRFVQGILFSLEVSLVLLLEFANSCNASLHVCFQVSGLEVPLFIEIESDFFEFFEGFFFNEGEMDFVVVSFFEDVDVFLEN
jgi:hypothetical protein